MTDSYNFGHSSPEVMAATSPGDDHFGSFDRESPFGVEQHEKPKVGRLFPKIQWTKVGSVLLIIQDTFLSNTLQ